LNPASAAAEEEEDVDSEVEGMGVETLPPFFWFIDFAHRSMS
jgi:hypothetical protein